MDRSDQIITFSSFFRVSRETIKLLNKYEKMLIEKNKEVNLIGDSTIKLIWNRHFLDSFQVIDFIDKNDKTIVDVGSGAGFPGLIIAIAAKERKMPLKVKRIEKSPKKSTFLESVIWELKLNAQVLNENIFEPQNKIIDGLLVFRAFKPLGKILELIHNKAKNWEKIFIFLGKTGKGELLQASKTWDIKYKQRVSITNVDSNIIEINNLKKIN